MAAGGVSPRFSVFVGRERELAELRHALDEARAGQGRLVLVSGEPGIGKTRIAEEIAREATSRGMRTVWGRCWEGEGAPAYWPWIQVIRSTVASLDPDGRKIVESEHAAAMVETIAQIVPELFAAGRAARPHQPTHADPQQPQFRLFDSVATLLKEAARLGPMVIFLDDLHDADSASLTVLRFVARELRTSGVLIVGTYREAEVRRSPELGREIGGLTREARSLPLAGLSPVETAEFYTMVVGRSPDSALAGRLYETTAGNPLFVDGIVRGLIAEHARHADVTSDVTFSSPHSVREAIARRLAKLSVRTRGVLEVAAVIGNEFDAAICMRVGEVSGEQLNSLLDEAARDGVVLATGQGRYRFAHALIRASIYDALNTNTRVRLHSAIGTAIEQMYPQSSAAHLDELAHHFRAAGATEKAIDYSHRAGEAAYAVFAYELAAAHWNVALQMTEGQRDARRAEILFGFGQAQSYLDPVRGIRSLEEALSLYRELENEERVAVTNANLGLALTLLPDFAPEMNVERALEYFREAQLWKGEWKDRHALGWLYHGLAYALFQQVRIDEALAAAKQARQIWERASNPAWVMSAAQITQLLTLKGKHREAAVLSSEVLRALQGISDPGLFQSTIWHLGWCRMLMRDPIEAKRYFALGAARRGLTTHQREHHLEFLGFSEMLSGNLAEAKALAAKWRTNPIFRRAIAHREGDWETGNQLLQTMLEWSHRTGHRWDVSDTLAASFESLRVSGHWDRAREVLQEFLRSYDRSVFLLEIAVRPQAALLALEAGNTAEAVEHLEVCRAILAQGEDWLGRAGLVERAEGVLAAAQGRDFAGHFEKAVAILRRYPNPFDEAEALDYWGRALLASGEVSSANEKFEAAIEIYRRHGAGQRWIDRVEAARNKPRQPATMSPTISNSCSVWRREGDFWTIAYNGKTSRVRNIKGLGYIAQLLGRPGARVHVIDLVEAVERGADGIVDNAVARARELTVERGLGDAGEMVDAQALEQYRRRQFELRAELDAAQRDNDPGRAEAARHELELITDQLSAAVGQTGRGRRARAHDERARSLVTKHVRSGLDLVRRNNSALATHLDRSIQTGTLCAYLPDPDEKLEWQT